MKRYSIYLPHRLIEGLKIAASKEKLKTAQLVRQTLLKLIEDGVDPKPIENKLIENKPIENKPIENKPIENKDDVTFI